jgi:hypothetical protein
MVYDNSPAGNKDHDGAAFVSSLMVDVPLAANRPSREQRFSLAKEKAPTDRSFSGDYELIPNGLREW